MDSTDIATHRYSLSCREDGDEEKGKPASRMHYRMKRVVMTLLANISYLPHYIISRAESPDDHKTSLTIIDPDGRVICTIYNVNIVEHYCQFFKWQIILQVSGAEK